MLFATGAVAGSLGTTDAPPPQGFANLPVTTVTENVPPITITVTKKVKPKAITTTAPAVVKQTTRAKSTTSTSTTKKRTRTSTTTSRPKTSTKSTTKTSSLPTIRPGSFCSPRGAKGQYKEITYTCKPSQTDNRNRWRR